jgi:hypothetical protein
MIHLYYKPKYACNLACQCRAAVAAEKYRRGVDENDKRGGTAPGRPRSRAEQTSTMPAKPKPNSKQGKRWSQRITETSSALDLEEGVFTLDDPRKIALSLKRSAERSHRRKSEPFRSAMSMLTFYINRAGKDLPAAQKKRLEAAKDELRRAFGRE